MKGSRRDRRVVGLALLFVWVGLLCFFVTAEAQLYERRGEEPAPTTEGDTFAATLSQAETPEALELLLKEHPEKRDKIIPKLEEVIIRQVRKEGVSSRFLIKEITPQSYKLTEKSPISELELPTKFVTGNLKLQKTEGEMIIGHLGMVTIPALGGVYQLRVVNTPSDFIKTGLSGSVTLRGSDSGNVTAVLQFPGDRILMMNPFSGGSESAQVLLGDGSIQRFAGKVSCGLPGGYTFTGEGDDLNLLTFGMLKGVGYVHLRGKGKVIMQDGKEVKLGH